MPSLSRLKLAVKVINKVGPLALVQQNLFIKLPYFFCGQLLMMAFGMGCAKSLRNLLIVRLIAVITAKLELTNC